MRVELKTVWGQDTAIPVFTRKPKGRLELIFYNTDGTPLMPASLQIDAADLDQDEIVVRDLAGTQGLAETLVANGLIHEPHRTHPTGMVDAQIARLTTKALEEAERQLDHDLYPVELEGVELP